MQINSLESTIIVTGKIKDDLEKVLTKMNDSRIFILADKNTRKYCFPLISEIEKISNADIIELPQGEENKSVDTVIRVWEHLSRNKADRNTLLINLTGGMLGDLGGFAASTFKRGIKFINIPTTLLAQVDASIGGKLGINFDGLKNEVGLFRTPEYVFVDPVFLKTLSKNEFLSGFAEMIKHALIDSPEHYSMLKGVDINNPDYNRLLNSISKSILIKNDFVKSDYQEKNLRKALNFGHTIGHALESLMLEKKIPISHGHAVAMGMICEVFLSILKTELKESDANEVINFILERYDKIDIKENDYDRIYELMLHDKKNNLEQINFTFIPKIGEVEINQQCNKESIWQSFDFFRSL